MLKMILMTQIYFTPGVYSQDYHFQNHDVYVRSVSDCKKMGEAILIKTLKYVRSDIRKNIVQTGFSCTDETQELDFWPIPDRIPIPHKRR